MQIISRVVDDTDRRYWDANVEITPELGLAIVVQEGLGKDGIVFSTETELNDFITALNKLRMEFRDKKDE